MANAAANTLGQVPSFVFTPAEMGVNVPYTPGYSGSMAGVPAVNAIAGEGMTSTQAHAEYAQTMAASAPQRQPIFWLFVLMILGVIILGFAAHESSRG